MDAINYHHRIEILEEEKRALEARIAHLTGKDTVADVRRVFGVTEHQARLFALLLARDVVSWGVMFDEVYDIERANMLEDPGNCIRSLMKHLRRKVRPHGIDFETIYAHGYRMSEECRAISRRKLAQMVAE